jgi:hypothetical protein
MTRPLFEIWQDGENWHAQMKNYVATFGSKGMAERYVAAIKKMAEQNKKA